MYTQEEIFKIMKERDVLLEGHFRLSSGRHAAKYLQCARLLQYPDVAEPLCAQLASKFKDDCPTVVVGPAIGAIVVSYEVARALGVKSLFTERENGEMTLRRGFSLNHEDRVLVVEDVITTGGSTKEVIEAVRKLGATVIGVGVIADRSAGKVDLGVPIKALVSIEIESYLPEECPFCAEGIPAIKPGSRQEKA